MTLPADVLSLFPITAGVAASGHLTIGGCDVVQLARAFGTPLYVFDEATLRGQCRAFQVAAGAARTAYGYPALRVAYAGKAYLGLRLLHIIAEEGLGLDVVSGGEMHMARAAGFPAGRVHLHGNNKQSAELRVALEWGIDRIIVDNLDELAALAALAEWQAQPVDVLLRLAPAVDPHTHRFLATGNADSKFGLPLAGGQAAQAVEQALAAPWLNLRGVHAHIGSQIASLTPYEETAHALLAFVAEMRDSLGWQPEELGLGGGWAVRHTVEESDLAPAAVVNGLADVVAQDGRRHGLPLPALLLEPGRSIAARAGVALYTVGAGKDVPGVRRFVFIDGGMADNIRPALYGARYTALVANRAEAAAADTVTIAGKYCESGDVLIKDAQLPPCAAGDILAVAACGAYAPAMASNYNLALRPAIVGVHQGQATLWRRRELPDDLLRYEM